VAENQIYNGIMVLNS